MKRSGSTGGRGFVGWVAMVLVVALLVGPALQEPTQYAMAQTNPAPAVKPVLAWLTEIQKIPVGEIGYYYQKAFVEKGIGESNISMEEILDGLAGLAKTQLRISEGQFVQILNEILGYDLEKDFEMAVEHTDFSETALGKKDWYELSINVRTIELILTDAFAGYEWGVRGLVLSEDKRSPKGSIYTEEKELVLVQVKDGQNPGEYIFGAIYTVRTRAPDGTVISLEQWDFVQGNPNAVWHRPMGPP